MNKRPIKYPYLELDLEDLAGEKWEDIPFLDGLYRVSDFGRIKRLDIEIINCLGHIMHYPSKILRSYPFKAKNKGINDYTYHISVAIRREGVKYKLSVSRLVYYCFVKKFALDDHSLLVLAKDGNGKNISPSNLQLASIGYKQKRIFERGRYVWDAETSYDEYINKGRIKSKNPRAKQVSQYSRKGHIIQTFPGIAAAAKVTGVSATSILSVLKKRGITGGGYVWGYGRKKSIDVAAIRNANLEHYRKVKGRKVTQYNLEGNKIASYLTIKDAAKKSNTNPSDIHAVLKGKQRSAGGFIWREGVGKIKINVEGLLTGEKWRAFRSQKKVSQYDKEGKFICTFPSVKDAARQVGARNSSISIALKNKTISKGFFWKLVDEKK